MCCSSSARNGKPSSWVPTGKLNHHALALDEAAVERSHGFPRIILPLVLDEGDPRVGHTPPRVPRHDVDAHEAAEGLEFGLQRASSDTVFDALDAQRGRIQVRHGGVDASRLSRPKARRRPKCALHARKRRGPAA